MYSFQPCCGTCLPLDPTPEGGSPWNSWCRGSNPDFPNPDLIFLTKTLSFHSLFQTWLTYEIVLWFLADDTAQVKSKYFLRIFYYFKSSVLTPNVPFLKCGQTSLIRTPKGQNQVSALQRCPYYRGRKCMIFGISGTKRTVRIIEVSVRRG